MKTFSDNEGREWKCEITTSALMRVRDGAVHNLGDESILHKTALRIETDALFVVECAWWIIRPQAEKRDVTKESFVDSMFGDVIEGARKAIEEEWVPFFPSPETRILATQLVANVRASMQNIAAIHLISSSTSTDSPASSESTPQT